MNADENYDFNFQGKVLKETLVSDTPLAGYDEQFNTMALKVPFNSVSSYIIFASTLKGKNDRPRDDGTLRYV